MRKITLVAASLTALFASTANAGDVQLVGYVPAVCEVSGLNTQLRDFGNVSGSANAANIGLTVECNDADGATIQMISAEGGLESDDAEDQSLPYTATLAIGAYPDLVLNAPGGVGTNGANVDASYSATGLLGGAAGVLSFMTPGGATWSGGYSDTLTVQIDAAN
ncbi:MULTISPECIES: hypothetical protein [Shewanella]|jgi:hypothetical protein|uniref:Spore coat protein U domain-containing protein n=1 Tax=Shewanella psychromarinicola TaxID=2487742 RepID=A0A3N4EC87_9GAMM|nr:hypothetical protein [Shewanella psychromarinicola]AZG36671.1 hypothetical protein EGC80_18585 [Shewanella psychromarinicola]MCL1082320.1 hypothetical protein [Shewanella psychromarinicola]RPA34522.1 hypothetical protein EGC77_02235 [Shewanella psychromarinicola]